MNKEMKDLCEDLLKLGEPILHHLREKGHPHMTVIIDSDKIKVTEDLTSKPIKWD